MSTHRDELSRISRTLRPLEFPRRFAVELCADCNLACSMCHHPFMKRPKGVMPFALWQRMADQIAELSPSTEVWISFCGEPFLEPELLFDVIRYGKSVGLHSINVNTNGQLLVPELVDPLIDTGVNLVVLGVDAFKSETYDKYRCGGDRDLLYTNAEHLLRRIHERGEGPEVQIQFIEMDENSDEVEECSAHWLSRGAVMKVRRQLSWGGQLEATFAEAEQAQQLDRIACPWALTMMHVFWDGRVPRCPGDTEGEEGFGNAWHTPLQELWAGLGGYRQHHLNKDFDALPERCHTCTDWQTGAAQRVRPKTEKEVAEEVAA